MKTTLTKEVNTLNEAFELQPRRQASLTKKGIKQVEKITESKKFLDRFCEVTNNYVLGYN